MGLTVCIADTVLGRGTHSARSHVVSRRIRWRAKGLDGAGCCVNTLALPERVLAHCDVVRMVIEMHVGNRTAPFVLEVGVERDAVGFSRQVLANEPHAGEVLVVVHVAGEVSSPTTRVQKRCHERNAQCHGFHFVAACKSALRVVTRFVAHDACHGRSAVHVNRVLEHAIDRSGHMAHVVAPDLAGAVCQSVREQGRGRQQEQTGRLDRVTGNAHQACLLPLLLAVLVEVDDPRNLSGGVVLDARHMAFSTQVHVASFLGLGQFGVQRGPLGAALAPLKAETDLHTTTPVVPWLAVDGHVTGMHFLVTQLFGACAEHLEVVVARQTRDAVGARDAHLVLGSGVVRLQFLQRHRPVHQVGACNLAIVGTGPEFVVLEPQRCASPVRRRAAHGFANPRGQVGEVFCQTPAARGGAVVQPCQLTEGFPLVVYEGCSRLHCACFEHNDLDTLLGEFVGERSATCAGPDDDDHIVVA